MTETQYLHCLARWSDGNLKRETLHMDAFYLWTGSSPCLRNVKVFLLEIFRFQMSIGARGFNSLSSCFDVKLVLIQEIQLNFQILKKKNYYHLNFISNVVVWFIISEHFYVFQKMNYMI